MAPPDPYLKKNPTDFIRPADWNDLQTRTRTEIHSHNHSGDAQGVQIGAAGIQAKAINGTHIDPATTAAVTDLTVTRTFKVGTRTLLSEVDGLVSRVTSLENGKVNRNGDTITGGLTVSNLLIAKEGSIAKCVSIGCETAEVPYEFEWETVGVSNPVCHLRLQSPNNIILHGNKGVIISKEYGGNGDLNVARNLQVDGLLLGKTTRPVREQLVHRRVLFGYAGDQPVKYTNTWTMVRSLAYAPFGYDTPALQEGAKRKVRLYAVYTDDINPTVHTTGRNEIRFALDGGGEMLFTLNVTWGFGQGDHQYNRDGLSSWFEGPPKWAHAVISVRTSVANTSGVLRYLEAQSWDVFE